MSRRCAFWCQGADGPHPLAGLERAKAEGKNPGRTKAIDDAAVLAWGAENAASIKATAEHFGISAASVKRACSKG